MFKVKDDDKVFIGDEEYMIKRIIYDSDDLTIKVVCELNKHNQKPVIDFFESYTRGEVGKKIPISAYKSGNYIVLDKCFVNEVIYDEEFTLICDRMITGE